MIITQRCVCVTFHNDSFLYICIGTPFHIIILSFVQSLIMHCVPTSVILHLLLIWIQMRKSFFSFLVYTCIFFSLGMIELLQLTHFYFIAYIYISNFIAFYVWIMKFAVLFLCFTVLLIFHDSCFLFFFYISFLLNKLSCYFSFDISDLSNFSSRLLPDNFSKTLQYFSILQT